MKNGTKILIVDDEATHRFMLESVLGSWGYSTAEADDGETALQMIQSNDYALVLMDIRMKTLSGLKALSEIKSRDRCIPVILMTAYCNGEALAEALMTGAVAVLDKPLRLGELKIVINRVMEQKCIVE
jgi:two-component system, NtrC family, response regulator HydG